MIRSESKIAQTFFKAGEGPRHFDCGLAVNFAGDVNTLLFVIDKDLYAAYQNAGQAQWQVERLQTGTHTAGMRLARNADYPAGQWVKLASLEDDLNRVTLSDVTCLVTNGEVKFDLPPAGALNINFAHRRPDWLERFYFSHNDDLPAYFVQFHQKEGDRPQQHAWLSWKSHEPGRSDEFVLIWNNFNFQPEQGLVCFPVSTLPMGKDPKDKFTFVSTEELDEGWRRPGVAFYTINQEWHSDWLWHCWIQRHYVTQRLAMPIRTMSHCFTGTAYPALQLFAIDKERGQIHWLEQTDGVMGGQHEDMNIDNNYGPRPVFAPWHCLVTTKRGEPATEFSDVAPLTVGTDEVMLFATDKDGQLWAMRRDLTNAQVWNATKLSHDQKLLKVKALANGQFAPLVPGATPDGRPQLFFSGHLEGETQESIWRVWLDNDVWTAEKILGN
jgi:hypothetical protein